MSSPSTKSSYTGLGCRPPAVRRALKTGSTSMHSKKAKFSQMRIELQPVFNALRTAGGRQPNPVYELFVLGELMVQPLYGYLLHEIVNMILGPFHRLSWGTLYPLIRGLEQEGFITSQVQKRRAGLLQTERGPSRKVYALTETGQTRFLALMLDPGDYNPDYPNLFAM